MTTNRSAEIYVSVDVETDGPIPGPHSMLSFGAAAFLEDGMLAGTFSRNLELLDGARPEPTTQAFWEQHPDAYGATRIDCVPPAQAMQEFVDWVGQLPGKPVFVGYPVTFDFLFIYWYTRHLTAANPFSHSGLDIKTMAMLLGGTGYRQSTKRNWPRRWFAGTTAHTHVALDDAIEQGTAFCTMLAEARQRLGRLSAGDTG